MLTGLSIPRSVEDSVMRLRPCGLLHFDDRVERLGRGRRARTATGWSMRPVGPCADLYLLAAGGQDPAAGQRRGGVRQPAHCHRTGKRPSVGGRFGPGAGAVHARRPAALAAAVAVAVLVAAVGPAWARGPAAGLAGLFVDGRPRPAVAVSLAVILLMLARGLAGGRRLAHRLLVALVLAGLVARVLTGPGLAGLVGYRSVRWVVGLAVLGALLAVRGDPPLRPHPRWLAGGGRRGQPGQVHAGRAGSDGYRWGARSARDRRAGRGAGAATRAGTGYGDRGVPRHLPAQRLAPGGARRKRTDGRPVAGAGAGPARSGRRRGGARHRDVHPAVAADAQRTPGRPTYPQRRRNSAHWTAGPSAAVPAGAGPAGLAARAPGARLRDEP